MNFRPLVIGASFLAHGALVYALGEIRVDEAVAATAIEVIDTTKEKPKPPPVEVEPPPPQKPEQRSRNTKPEAAPPPDAAPPPTDTAPLADLPDFGLDLSGGSGSGGFAIAQGKGPLNAPRTAPIQKSLTPSSAPAPAADTCLEPAAKPKLVHAPQPAYTDAARAAGIEGKVRLQLTVDENGKVLDAKIVSGLGYGLDDLALAAARAVTFEGAVRCGKPARSTVNFAFRFSAS